VSYGSVKVQVPMSFHAFAPPGLPLGDSLHLSSAAVGAESSRDRVVMPELARPGLEQAVPSEWRK
jgi:hypothetical protein